MNNKKGFTLVELLVVIAIIALLIGLLLPALAKARFNAQSLKDKTQIQQVHKSAIVYASDHKGKLPLPGDINRLGDFPAPPGVGNLPGHGAEDSQKNTSGNLYSAMISQNCFKPDVLIGTTEVNANIMQRTDYDYNAFKPANDVYWDGDNTNGGTPNTRFLADPGVANCNVSYAHSALCGVRKRNSWRDSQSSGFACFGTRGTGGSYNSSPNGGATSGAPYEKSPTLELHGPKQQWDGHVVFNDNHAETLNTFFAPLRVYFPSDSTNSNRKDNIYCCEFLDFNVPGTVDGGYQASGDSWLGMFTVAEPNGMKVTPKWDPEI